MMSKFLMWLTDRLPVMLIQDQGRPYLERYYLGTLFNVRLYIHRFVDSDPDRGLHDHPWRWALSFILSGWYYEHNRYGIRKVRFFNRLSGDSFHRVVLPFNLTPVSRMDNNIKVFVIDQMQSKRPVWTLFMHHAPRSKAWGFLRDKGQLGTAYTTHVPSGDPEWWLNAPRARDLRAEVRT